MSYNIANPWIKEREATLCTWKFDYDRGFFNNMNVSNMTDFCSFSKRQIKEYVKMMKACGFTGIQVTDICMNWRVSGSWENVHDRYKELANALHDEGMNFTVWAWAAMFTGHGWNDDEVCYTPSEGYTAYTDPKVFACFNKYYDIYADLASCCDRLIAHFYDPGMLTEYDDIFKYAKLLFDKFRAINPDVKFGIDTWGCPSDFHTALVNAGFKDIMLMELPFLPSWRESGKRAAFRRGVLESGCELGSWGWYTAEYEIDQNAAMFVNAKVLRDVYQNVREQGDSVMIPSYWSEMDSYHTLNMFSMYCAGHLLINPDSDPDLLINDAARKVFGDKYAESAARALFLIQDARSGGSWKTYWWTEPEFALGTNDPEDIAGRAAESLKEMTEISKDKSILHEMPLPIEPNKLAAHILPHIDQIKQYAEFRIEMKKLDAMLDSGADKETLYEALGRIWKPIPDYNCVIGVWGQYEMRYQTYAVRGFCKKADIKIPERPLRKYLYKKRFFEYFAVHQRGLNEPVRLSTNYYEGGIPLRDENDEIIESLISDGLLEKDSEGKVMLRDYDAYKYDLNI